MFDVTFQCEGCGRPSTRRLYSAAEAARHMGIANGTLNTWRNDGSITGKLVGRGYMYESAAMDQALKWHNYDRANLKTEVILR